MVHFATIGGPCQTVGNLKSCDFLVDFAIGGDAIQRCDGLLVGIIIHRPDPERTIRANFTIVGAAVNAIINRGDFGPGIGIGIEIDDVFAKRHNQAPLIGQAKTSQFAVKRPCFACTRCNIQRMKLTIKDIGPIKPVILGIPVWAFAQCEGLI